jgi:hypothetical protein
LKIGWGYGTIFPMDDEDKKKLDRILALAEENNQYVRSVRQSQKTSQMWKAIYWVIIGTMTIAGYYAIKPYIGTFKNLYSMTNGKDSSGLQLPTKAQLQGYVDQFKNK